MPKSKTGNIEALNTNLNLVLDKATINTIVRGVIGRKGGKLLGPGSVAIGGDYCCVDASVGSSAIGPASTVGSSVSYAPDRPGAVGRAIRKAPAKRKVSAKVKAGKDVRIAVKVPRSVKVR